jgi:hypothetical protein
MLKLYFVAQQQRKFRRLFKVTKALLELILLILIILKRIADLN